MAAEITGEKYLKAIKGVVLSTDADATNAYLRLVAAELDEESITFELVKSLLDEVGIVYEIKENTIRALLESPVHNQPVVIAEGVPMQPGDDAELHYLVNLSPSHQPTVDERGNVDYKNLNYIQNAHAGQILLRKTPPAAGTAGMSVFGREIPARPGRDRPIPLGTNTELSHDGLALVAKIDGTIGFKNNLISVHPSQQISGSIDSSIGNINCIGSLKIGKNITSGFQVHVGQDLDVGGHVEEADIAAGGNVLIRGGAFGGGKGTITAGGDLTVKFLENQKVRADGTIYVGGEVLNCDVYADEAVLVQGKSGRIAGGSVAAKYAVRCAYLGNDASVPTHVRVAYDIRTFEALREAILALERLAADEKRIKDALVWLYRQEMKGTLPPDKREALAKFKQFMRSVPEQRQALEKRCDDLKSKLTELAGARIIVDVAIYPGVVIHIGTLAKEVLEEMRGPLVYEKIGDSITCSPFEGNKERQLTEDLKELRRKKDAAREKGVQSGEECPSDRLKDAITSDKPIPVAG